MKKNIVVCPGHNKFKQGARNKELNLVEYTEVLKISYELIDFLRDYSCFGATLVKGTLPFKVREINKIKPDICLDIHLNSSVSKYVRGTETLHSGSFKSICLAEKVQKELVACLEIPNRGIKKGYYRMDENNSVLYFLRKTLCPAIILEPLFMSNQFDADFIRPKILAEAIGLGIVSYFREQEFYC